MKKRILSVLLVLSLVLCMGLTTVTSYAAETASAEKQLYHLAIENQLFGSYVWGTGGVAYPDNSMAAFYGWGGRTINSLYNGGSWGSSGVIVRVRNYINVNALGDVYMDATKLTDGLGDRGESSFARKVQLWKVVGFIDSSDNAQLQTAMGTIGNWTKVAEVTVAPDKTVALAAGKGFNWTDLATPVLLTPGEVYVIVVEQNTGAGVGVWGNPRPNEINNVLAVHPDNIANEVGETASESDFYMSGAPIGTFGVNPVDIQNAIGGSMWSGGNLKYEVVQKSVNAAPVASAVTTTTATITWTAAMNSMVFGNVGGYKVLVSEDGGEPTTTFVSGKDTTSLALTGLSPNTEYMVSVVAVTVATENGMDVATYADVTLKTNAVAGATATPTPVENPTTSDNFSPIMLFMIVGIAIMTISLRKKFAVK